MTKRKVGRPMSDRMQEALRRVAAGETALHVAHDLGFKNSQQLYVALARKRRKEVNAAASAAQQKQGA